MSYCRSDVVVVMYQQMLDQLLLLREQEMDDFVACTVVAEDTASMCDVIAAVAVIAVAEIAAVALDYSHGIRCY